MRRLLAVTGLGLAALPLAVACSSDSPERCFEPDATSYGFVDATDTTAWFRWSSSDYPVRVYAEPVGGLEAHADGALALWVAAFRCGELSMVRWPDSASADIVIRNPPVEPPRFGLGRSVPADSVNACRGRTDIELLPTSPDTIARPVRSYVWPVGTDPGATEACYRFVAAHELGHALGLFRHSLDTSDIMHQRPRRLELSPADRYTIQLLYNTAPSLVAEPR